MAQTFYDLLGVSPDATVDEIEAAYREEIKQVHPDVSDDVDASERAARLNKAKDVLTEEDERARYDRLGHASYVSGTDSATTTGQSGGESAGGDGSSTTGSRTPGSGVGGATHQSPGANDRRAGRSGRHTASVGNPGGERSAGESRNEGSWQGESPSARRQAAANATPGPNVDGSWNAWGRTRAWAVRQGQETGGQTGLRPGRLFPGRQSLFLLGTTFVLYPVFVFSAALPTFHLLARLVVAACTILLIIYLLSMPEVAMLVFGLWSILLPLVILVYPGSDLISAVGVAALFSTWVPLGLSVLTYTALRPG
jgi:hypothetical protein